MYQYEEYSIWNIWGCTILAHITSTRMSSRTGNRPQHQTHTIVTTATKVFVPSNHNLLFQQRTYQCSVSAFTSAVHHQNHIPLLLLLHGPGHEDREFSCPKLLSTAWAPQTTENVLPIHNSAQTGKNNVPLLCLSANWIWCVLPEQMTLFVWKLHGKTEGVSYSLLFLISTAEIINMSGTHPHMIHSEKSTYETEWNLWVACSAVMSGNYLIRLIFSHKRKNRKKKWAVMLVCDGIPIQIRSNPTKYLPPSGIPFYVSYTCFIGMTSDKIVNQVLSTTGTNKQHRAYYIRSLKCLLQNDLRQFTAHTLEACDIWHYV